MTHGQKNIKKEIMCMTYAILLQLTVTKIPRRSCRVNLWLIVLTLRISSLQELQNCFLPAKKRH